MLVIFDGDNLAFPLLLNLGYRGLGLTLLDTHIVLGLKLITVKAVYLLRISGVENLGTLVLVGQTVFHKRA